MLINKKYKIATSVLLLLLVLTPVLRVSGENSPDSQTQINSHSNIKLLQVGIVQPNLFIQSVEINNGNLAEDGDTAVIDVEILNEDDVSYIGLDLVIEIEENGLVQHGPAPMPTIYNKSLDIIPSATTLKQQLSFQSTYGQYTLTASLATNSSILPNSVHIMTFQVINKPIGSVLLLTFALISVIFMLLILVASPLLIEKFKSKYFSKQK